MIDCDLADSETQTAFGPLCALGHYLSREEVLGPLQEIELPQKTVKHSPQEKLLDALMGILGGCRAL
jgi:hypothetical protein